MIRHRLGWHFQASLSSPVAWRGPKSSHICALEGVTVLLITWSDDNIFVYIGLNKCISKMNFTFLF